MPCFRDSAHLASCSSHLLAVILLLQTGFSLATFDENGNYKICGTVPELWVPSMTGKIRGGVDMLVKHPRQDCRKRTYEENRYRTYDGTCNNPGNKGAAFSLIKRLIPPAYHDVDVPRQYGKDYRRLPNPRVVSRTVHKNKDLGSEWTLMAMQFGQFLDHDISAIAVPTERNSTIECCNVPPHQRHHDCFPIEIPSDDPYFKNCMEFVRSEPARHPDGSIIYPRRHENVITSFVDASNVYGNDPVRAAKLRTKGGKGALLQSYFYKGKERLPGGSPDMCISTGTDGYCAIAGDERVNTHPALAAVHTIYLKEHNRLTRKLVAAILSYQGYRNTPLDVAAYLDTAPYPVLEKIFQTIRKIMGAVLQSNVYGEFLPMVLGPAAMTKYKLWTGSRIRYDPKVDPSLENSFATAAYRFGHTMIPNIMRMGKSYFLKDLFSESSHTLEKYELMCQGLINWQNPAEEFDGYLADAITNHLFANNKEHRPGFDLASLNLQRGRDHGTSGINAYRQYFGLRPYANFEQFGDCALSLRSLYGSPDDIDFFTGGICEKAVEGAIVGETFAEVIGQQFHDLKFGDRYFFETDDPYYGFTIEQLISISRLSLSKVMCENGDLDYIQINPFFHANAYKNPVAACKQLPDIDLSYWAKEFGGYY